MLFTDISQLKGYLYTSKQTTKEDMGELNLTCYEEIEQVTATSILFCRHIIQIL